MKTTQALLITLVATVFTLGSAHADQTYWTGIDIDISDAKATVSVSLTSFVDSADSGKIVLVVQDENHKGLKVIDSSGSAKDVRRGTQSLKLTRIVEIKPDQKKIQVWTPVFPEGQTKSTTPVFREYELKRLQDDTVIAVLASQEQPEK